MSNFEKYRNLIQKDFPEFSISSIKKIGEGDNSKAFLINEHYIFRFPKRRKVKQQIQREIYVLPKIKSLIKLSVPEFEFISPQLKFVGYQKINGDILSNKIFLSLPENQQEGIQNQLGIFLTQIHSFSPDDLKDCGLEIMDLKEEYSENFEEARQLIFPHISKSQQKIITRLFMEYVNNAENFNYSPTLVHNDFSKDHILVNTVNKQISGIIDFGDIAYGDPDYDFMYLLDEYGETFLKKVLINYKNNNHNISMEKIIFFTLGSKIQILLRGKNDNDDDEWKSAINDLEVWFKKYYPHK